MPEGTKFLLVANFTSRNFYNFRDAIRGFGGKDVLSPKG
jgi:hypothetical protein